MSYILTVIGYILVAYTTLLIISYYFSLLITKQAFL